MLRPALFVFSFLFACMGSAHPGIGIVMDSQGNVYYTDLVHVWRISADGDVTIAVENVHTHELYIDDSDNLYGEHEWYEGEATDKWGNYVWCLSSDGVLEKTVPDVEGFLSDNTLVRDAAGATYWSEKEGDREVVMRSAKGNELRMSDHLFDDIRWMHYGRKNGKLYVVDRLSLKELDGEGQVRVLSPSLKEKSKPLFGVADHHYVYGVWEGNDSDVFVAVFGAGKVKRFDAKGEQHVFFESAMGWSPCGGLTAQDGTHWIMEFSKWNTTRVRRIAPDGSTTVFKS